MNSKRFITIVRWCMAFAALAGIVLVYSRWLRVNQTTVALTLLLLILALAAKWGLRYAVAISLAATLAYNYFFLPPIGTITIADTENWLALMAFLVTAVVGSRLSQRARDEADSARARQRELELSFQLSRELLQLDNVSNLLTALPTIVARVSGAPTVMLYLLEQDRIFQKGLQSNAGFEIPHMRRLALSLRELDVSQPGEARIPLLAGVRPRGLLTLQGIQLSKESLQSIGGLVAISLDRAQALEEIAKTEANKEGERLRTIIIDSITHELRTPLTSIKGAASALLADIRMADEHRDELLHIVDEESDRLNLLVDKATEMAQLDSQQIHMSFAPCNVLDLITVAETACATALATHPITVSIETNYPVLADAEYIEKVLINLLENASKYSTKGSPVFLTARDEDSYVAISVADRGYGIDTGEQSLVFERFYRARSSSNSATGTGMGLAISKAIVEAHGGTMQLTSQPGHGSVFTFTLQRATTQENAA
jgi:two-component system sensor histidine kinase KdpD